jgi:Family of unknown function (DUF5989)
VLPGRARGLLCYSSVRKLADASHRIGIMGEFFGYLWRAKLWWMMPMFFIIFLFGLLLILGQSSALAPFIYTIF